MQSAAEERCVGGPTWEANWVCSKSQSADKLWDICTAKKYVTKIEFISWVVD